MMTFALMLHCTYPICFLEPKESEFWAISHDKQF